MRRMICVLMVLLPFLVLPALGAELSFPQVDELFQEAEGYGVTETDGLGQGVQSILETGLDQAGSLLQHSLQTGLKLLAARSQESREDHRLPRCIRPLGLGAKRPHTAGLFSMVSAPLLVRLYHTTPARPAQGPPCKTGGMPYNRRREPTGPHLKIFSL